MQLHLKNTSTCISLTRIFTVSIVSTSCCFQKTEEQIQFLILKKLKSLSIKIASSWWPTGTTSGCTGKLTELSPLERMNSLCIKRFIRESLGVTEKPKEETKKKKIKEKDLYSKVKMNVPLTTKRFTNFAHWLHAPAQHTQTTWFSALPTWEGCSEVMKMFYPSPSQTCKRMRSVAGHYWSTLVTLPPLPIYVITLLNILLPSAA